MGDPMEIENAGQSPSKPTYQGKAAEMKRPLAEKKGVGHGRGKHPKTLLRREQSIQDTIDEKRRSRRQPKPIRPMPTICAVNKVIPTSSA